MLKKKKMTLILTGKTERQWADEMRLLELAEEHKIGTPSIRTCYLCKREEGERSLHLVEEDEDKFNLMPIQLKRYAFRITPGISVSYLLCFECAVLVDAMGQKEPVAAED